MKKPVLAGLYAINLALVAALAAFVGACGGGGSEGPEAADGLRVLRLPMRTDGPNTLDPVQGSTTYDNRSCSQIYQTLLQYKYLYRPEIIESPQQVLEPLLLERMPEISDDGLTYSFFLRDDVYFQDNECFPDGKGRKLVSADVFYSWKRMADRRNQPNSWWLYADTIVGFDEFRAEQDAALDAGREFDYGAPVEGMKIVDDRSFQVTLKEPIYRLLWILAMFQTAVIPREAVEHYGERFPRNPVGTGPFMLERWEQGKSLILVKNPTYREELYPSEISPNMDPELASSAGKRLPLVDRVEITMFVQDNPMWLQFVAGNLDYTQTPAENFEAAWNKRTLGLRPEFQRKGMKGVNVQLLDLIFRGFNMDDPVVGGYTDEKRALRHAISLALDWEEQNETFYNGVPTLYDGMIPPGLDGYPKDGKAPVSYRQLDLDLARRKLAEAGFPGGEGLPAIEYWSNTGGNSPEQVEMVQKHLAEIGIQLSIRLVDFSQLIDAIDSKQAQMFSFAWGSDYPDAENNLAILYGPNESPGANHYNYKRDEYDRMYEQVRLMPPGPERTELIVRMRDMVIEDAPFCGSMARIRHYVLQGWLKNFEPSETFYNWIKYMDVDMDERVSG